MATVATQNVRNGAFDPGVDIDHAAAANDDFVNSPDVVIAFRNDDAAPKEITIAAQDATIAVAGVGDVAVEDIVITVPAGETRFYNVPTRGYADASNSNKTPLAYDDTTSLFVKAVRFARL